MTNSTVEHLIILIIRNISIILFFSHVHVHVFDTICAIFCHETVQSLHILWIICHPEESPISDFACLLYPLFSFSSPKYIYFFHFLLTWFKYCYLSNRYTEKAGDYPISTSQSNLCRLWCSRSKMGVCIWSLQYTVKQAFMHYICSTCSRISFIYDPHPC